MLRGLSVQSAFHTEERRETGLPRSYEFNAYELEAFEPLTQCVLAEIAVLPILPTVR